MHHCVIHDAHDCEHEGKRGADAVRGRFGKNFPPDLVRRKRAMLSAMDAAVVLEDLCFPPGNHLEALKGDRAGQHAIRINDQWRICEVVPRIRAVRYA